MNDIIAWRAAAHKIKGAAANLGARILAKHCERAEFDDVSLADERVRLLGEITSEIACVRHFFESRTGEPTNTNAHIH